MRRQVHGRRQPRPAPGGAPQGEWGPGTGKGIPVGCWGGPGGLLELLQQSRGCPSHRLPAPVGAGGRAQPMCASPTVPQYFGCCSALFWAHAGGIPPGGGCGGFCSLPGCPCPAGQPPGWGLCSARRPGSRQLGRDPAACHARKIPDNTILQAVCPKKGATACCFFWLSTPLASPSRRGAQGRCLSTARLDVALAPSR